MPTRFTSEVQRFCSHSKIYTYVALAEVNYHDFVPFSEYTSVVFKSLQNVDVFLFRGPVRACLAWYVVPHQTYFVCTKIIHFVIFLLTDICLGNGFVTILRS